MYTFFFDAEAGKHREAIELLLQRMKFIPTDPEDVSAAVDQFHMVADEVLKFIIEKKKNIKVG